MSQRRFLKVTIIIVALIVLYVGYVIYKKIKDIKAGKFCNCGCSDCPSSRKCNSHNKK